MSVIDPTTLALFTVAAAALVAVPGPNHLYIVARGISQGRSAGLWSAFGVETGTLIHTLATAAGLSLLIARSTALFAVLRWAGVAYLIYLGVRTLTGRGAGNGMAAKPQPLSRVYLEGVLVNLLNPKVVLFFLAFVPQFVDPARHAAGQIIVYGSVLAAIGLTSNLVYALTAGSLGNRLRHRAFTYAGGVIYLALGIATALTGTARAAP